MIAGLAAWLGGKLLTSTGIVPKSGILIIAGAIGVAGVMVGVMIAIVVSNIWLRGDIRELRETNEAVAGRLSTCQVDLGTSQSNVSTLEAKLVLQNDAMQAFADGCRAADERGAMEALQVLQPPQEVRRFPEGAEGMNEWLATK